MGQPNPQGNGKRHKQNYNALGCKASFCIAYWSASENGGVETLGKLEVREASLEHTHDAVPEEHARARFYCKRRCLSTEEKEEAKKLVKMNVKPTEVLEVLAESTGKSILTRTIHWIASMVDNVEHGD